MDTEPVRFYHAETGTPAYSLLKARKHRLSILSGGLDNGHIIPGV